MTIQSEHAKTFRAFHIKGEPIVLFNAWDAGSARAIAESGAKAIATGSWSVAAAHGFDDGEALPLELAIANLERIVASVNLPVTIDIESGYGTHPEQVQATLRKVIAAGAVGVNFEDGVIGTQSLYAVAAQNARIRALRETVDQSGIAVFINARTDVYLNAEPASDGETLLDEALRRVDAYAEAGASGFFAPGLKDIRYIERLCARSPLPVNIMTMPGGPTLKQLAEAGVARISHGPGPYRLAMEALQEASRKALSLG